MSAVHVAGTEPYPWPWDGRMAGSHLALVLAGWDVGWGTRTHEPVAAERQAGELAAAVAGIGGLVVAVGHGTAVRPLPVEPVVITAAGVDGFHGSALDTVLRASGRTHLLVAGSGLEGPVHSTLRSANDRGYECLMITDASAALVADLVPAAVKTVTMSGGIFGAVGSTAAVLAALSPNPLRPQEP